MPSLFDLLTKELSLHRQSADKDNETQGETHKMAASVTSTDDESIDEDDEPITTPTVTIDDAHGEPVLLNEDVELTFDDWNASNDLPNEDVELPFDDRNDITDLPNEGVVLSFDESDKEEDECKLEKDKREGHAEPETKPEQQKDTKLKTPFKGLLSTISVSKLLVPKKPLISSSNDSMLSTNKREDSKGSSLMEEEESGEDYSLLTASTDQSSTFEPASPLRALAAEQQEAMDKEMDELISESLVGFNNAVIEKELDDQKSAASVAGYVSTDVENVAEGLLAAWVDRLDYLAPHCGDTRCGTRYRHADDDELPELESVQSSHSGSDVVIEKELDNQKLGVSIAELVSFTNVQTGTERLSAALVDLLSCGGCGTTAKCKRPDGITTIAPALKSDGNVNEIEDLKDLVLMAEEILLDEIVLDDDDTATLLVNGDDNTILTLDDESLASEYDDFNKAMMMLKRRAAQHRLSEANLLQKIQTEQERRKSQGLSPTMIEI